MSAPKLAKQCGRILVTGGAGFIGSHALLALLAAGYDCVSFDNYDNSSAEAISRVEKLAGGEKRVTVVEVDLIQLPELSAAFAKHGPFDAVVHFAGFKAVGESTALPLHYYYNNVVGSLNLFLCMEQYGVSNLVFSSSCTVYGNLKKQGAFVEEDSSGQANCAYGWTKVHIEQILRDAAQANPKLKCIFLRYFNPVGAHESGELGEDPLGVPNNLFPFVAQVANGKRDKLMVFGNDYDTVDGTGVRDYIHVMDLADAHVLALQRQLSPKQQERVEVYNVGELETVTVRIVILIARGNC
ncbi:UDP-glucose 4-epimerase GalE [Batrachochytrium salamandrivorans]|nr:UDP-glucose 4-epimerase GalE [Batrachochytrium salamandrivorans]